MTWITTVDLWDCTNVEPINNTTDGEDNEESNRTSLEDEAHVVAEAFHRNRNTRQLIVRPKMEREYSVLPILQGCATNKHLRCLPLGLHPYDARIGPYIKAATKCQHLELLHVTHVISVLAFLALLPIYIAVPSSRRGPFRAMFDWQAGSRIRNPFRGICGPRR